MIKSLWVLVVVSTLLLLGCMDLSGSGSNSDTNPDSPPNQNPTPLPDTDAIVGSEFFGVWQSGCVGNEFSTITVSSELIIVHEYEFENRDCTGEQVEISKADYEVSYGEKVMASSGVEVTQVIIVNVEGPVKEVLDLMYRDGTQLYFGMDIHMGEGWPTEINFDYDLTLQL